MLLTPDSDSRERRADDKLRQKLIQETERFLTARLSGQQKNESSKGKYSRGRHTIDGGGTRNRQSDLPNRICIGNGGRRSTAPLGTFVEVVCDDHGHLEREHLTALRERLLRLLESAHQGDILLDLTGVRQLGPEFSRLIDDVRTSLRLRGREISLFHQGFGVVAVDPLDEESSAA